MLFICVFVGFLAKIIYLSMGESEENFASIKNRLEAMELIHRADRFANENKHKDALDAYHRVLLSKKLNEHKHIILYNMATSFVMVNRPDKAKDALLEIIPMLPDSEPKKVEVFVKIAEVCSTMQDWKCASSFFERAVLINPFDSSTLANYAKALLNVNDMDYTKKAIKVLQKASSSTLTPRLRCELGIALTMVGRLSEAESELEICRRETNQDIELHANIGLRIGDKELKQSIAHYEIVVNDDKSLLACSAANAVVYRLGRAYRSTGRNSEEQGLYVRAAELGIIFNTLQRPGYFHKKFVDMGSYAASPIPVYYPGEAGMKKILKKSWKHVDLLIKRLEDNADVIRDEFIRSSTISLDAPESDDKKDAITANKALKVTVDMEGIVDRGQWKQIPIVRDGKLIADQKTQGLVATMGIINDVLRNEAIDLPLGAVEISVLSPHSHLQAHCGPTNHKLRLHLGLVIPEIAPPTPKKGILGVDGALASVSFDSTVDGGAGISRESAIPSFDISMGPHIRIGNELYGWVRNKVLMFDDSYEHEVFNPTNYPRVVLILDIWHPDISPKERANIRQSFTYIS